MIGIKLLNSLKQLSRLWHSCDNLKCTQNLELPRRCVCNNFVYRLAALAANAGYFSKFICFHLNPAAAGSLPTLITHTQQTPAGKGGHFRYGRLAPEATSLPRQSRHRQGRVGAFCCGRLAPEGMKKGALNMLPISIVNFRKYNTMN